MNGRLTAGPWTLVGMEVRGPNGELIANVGLDDNLTYDECEANGDLIAGSPDLLDAAEAFLVAIDRDYFANHSIHRSAFTIGLRSAVAKVRAL